MALKMHTNSLSHHINLSRLYHGEYIGFSIRWCHDSFIHTLNKTSHQLFPPG